MGMIKANDARKKELIKQKHEEIQKLKKGRGINEYDNNAHDCEEIVVEEEEDNLITYREFIRAIR
jgi:hypothetical protein